MNQAAHPLFSDTRAQFEATADPVLFNRVEGPSEIAEEYGKIANEDVEHSVSDEVFSNYKHTEFITGSRTHPGNIVEAGSLAAINLPPITYPLEDSIPEEIISSGKLSGLQLEGIVLASQRHQIIYSDGTRAGFFLGDGAGVGKGRQISGIIFDNFVRGRTKSIWFSISADLIMDARRDLADIGCYVKVIEGCQELDRETRVLGLPKDFREGVVFSTYATLVSSVVKGGAFSSARSSRLNQLVEWCGGDEFSGCLIFDECHKAKNFIPGKEGASTKIALAVTQIQRMLPKARVLYCSATGVTNVKNMAFMERLGLWGEGAPFKSFDVFMDIIQKKGLGVAEMLTMEMKTSGMYVSRGLGYHETEFQTLEVDLTEKQIQMYDTAAHLWCELKRTLETAIDRTNYSNGRIWSSFWGAHQRFFKQLCLGMKVPAIVEECKKALDNGFCVVLGLQTTGEASLESEISNNGVGINSFVSLCRTILHRFITQHFPTEKEMKGEQNSTEKEVDTWSATAKEMLLNFTGKIQLPNSPLDELIDKLGGPKHVAEMTGRNGRMVRYSQKDKPHYELRGQGNDATGAVERLNVKERNDFMAGHKLIALISDAASTGISLHADSRVTNQRRRLHITVELPWSADKAVQQLGRSHRSNQTSGPLYKLLTTNLGGERRFAAAVAKRLQSLGALTKGDRRAASGADLTEFNFDTPYGRSALKTMYSCICQKQIVPGIQLSQVIGKDNVDFSDFNSELKDTLEAMGILDKGDISNAAKVKDKDNTHVGKFLNRILGLKVKQQNKIFNYFCKCLETQLQVAKKDGSYNEGLVDINATSVVMIGKQKEIFEKYTSSNNPTKHAVLQVDRGMSWEAALKRLEVHGDSKGNGFYWSKREVRGKRLHVLATRKEGSAHVFKVARPNTGVSNFDEDEGDFYQKYDKITPEFAEKGWRELYEHSKDKCIHGPSCKNGKTCQVGARAYHMHLLCGGTLNIMSLLEATISKYSTKLQLTKAEKNLRVVRAQLDSGKRVIGIRYPQVLIPLAVKTLEEQTILQELQNRQRSLVNGSDQLLKDTLSLSSLYPNVSKSKHFETEEVSPVIGKNLVKATTPPVTIKNFFKPACRSQSSTQETSGVCHQTKEEKSLSSITQELIEPTNGEQKDKKRQDILPISLNCEPSLKKNPNKRRSSGDASETPLKKQKQNATMSLFANKQIHKTGGESSDSTLTMTKQKVTSSFVNKSTSEFSDTPMKKQKQKTTSLSTNKQTSKDSGRDNKSITCPICSFKFPPGTWNSEVNAHIDNCLT